MSDGRGAWANFWAAGSTGPGKCLPDMPLGVQEAQRALWQNFARSLPRGGQVLDIGTGDGAVLGKMQAARRDLKLTGVDSSPSLPPSAKGITLVAGTSFEDLPFADGRFDAVTSQFGYEYGDTRSAAPEIARVLKGGGKMLFAIHRRDGPIVTHNLSRREALRWALQSGWLEKGRALSAARRMTPLPTPPAFRSAPQEGQRAFPNQPVASEFLHAVLQTVEMGRRRPPAEAIEILNSLETRARNEISRIDTLEKAARDAGQIAGISAELDEAGISLEAPGALVDGDSNQPFAWLLRGSHRSA